MDQVLPREAIAVAAALLWLAMAVLLARAVRGTGESRLRRILIPAGFFFFGILLAATLPLLTVGLSFSPTLETLWVALAVLAGVGAADSVAVLLGAERTQSSLAGGIVAAVLLVYAAMLAWLGVGAFQLTPFLAVPGLVAAAAAITWWPYLPAPEGEGPDDEAAAEVFE